MKMIKTSGLAILLTTALLSCKKTNIELAATNCMNKKIESFKKDNAANKDVSIATYDFQGKKVYLFTKSCCDFANDLFDENCNLICQPSGGITGNGDGKCPTFFQESSNEKIIWTNH